MNKSHNHPGLRRRRSSLRRRRSRKVVKPACGHCRNHKTKRTGSCSRTPARRRRSNRRRSSRRRSLRGGFVRQHSVQQFMTGERK